MQNSIDGICINNSTDADTHAHINILFYYDGVKLPRKMMGYITAILARPVVYNPLMFNILPVSN